MTTPESTQRLIFRLEVCGIIFLVAFLLFAAYLLVLAPKCKRDASSGWIAFAFAFRLFVALLLTGFLSTVIISLVIGDLVVVERATPLDHGVHQLIASVINLALWFTLGWWLAGRSTARRYNLRSRLEVINFVTAGSAILCLLLLASQWTLWSALLDEAQLNPVLLTVALIVCFLFWVFFSYALAGVYLPPEPGTEAGAIAKSSNPP
jgi:hypothetical protein